MSKITQVFDEVGSAVEVGDLVAKAQRQSSSVWLNVYEVLELVEKKGWGNDTFVKIRGKIVATTGWRSDIDHVSTILADNIIKVTLP